MISILAPSRGRAEKSLEALSKVKQGLSQRIGYEIIISIDDDDPQISAYEANADLLNCALLRANNRSAVDAINRAAQASRGDILIVASDDTTCPLDWDLALYNEIQGKSDWILKTQDGIQDWIITMPVMDRAYYNRFGYIYDPDFLHMFCDTWLTVQADISGRKITSNLKFPHLNGSIQDDLRKRCDATWVQGEKTFIQKVKSTPVEYLNKITDRGMKNWIRNKTGIRV